MQPSPKYFFFKIWEQIEKKEDETFTKVGVY